MVWGSCLTTVLLPCRYSKQADWGYIRRCAQAAPGLQLIGNGDVMSYSDYNARLAACPELATVMLARGALVKPWLFTEARARWIVIRLHVALHAAHALCMRRLPLPSRECSACPPASEHGGSCRNACWSPALDCHILCQAAAPVHPGRTLPDAARALQIKEQRHWDISARERLDLLREFCGAGLLHWGSDARGVESTRCGAGLCLYWLPPLNRTWRARTACTTKRTL